MSREHRRVRARPIDVTKAPLQVAPTPLPDKEVARTFRVLVYLIGQCITASGRTLEDAAEHTRFPLDVLQEVVGGRALLADIALSRLLRLCGASDENVQYLRFMNDDLIRARPEIRRWAPPARPLPPKLLPITTKGQLAQALRFALAASGVAKKYLAQQTGLSRSQLYNLIKDQPMLPRKPGQLRQFLEACSVPPEQVTEVLEQWHALDLVRYAA